MHDEAFVSPDNRTVEREKDAAPLFIYIIFFFKKLFSERATLRDGDQFTRA